MKFFFLSALFALSSAFVISSGTADGLYMHTLHKNGSHTHTLLSRALDHGIVRWTALSAKFRKARGGIIESILYRPLRCSNGNGEHYQLNKNDVDGGIKQFHQGCNPRLNLSNSGNDVYSVYGTAIFFMCYYAEYGQWCRNEEFYSALQAIRGGCGDHYGMETGECFFSFE
jgi:hypothetical protein